MNENGKIVITAEHGGKLYLENKIPPLKVFPINLYAINDTKKRDDKLVLDNFLQSKLWFGLGGLSRFIVEKDAIHFTVNPNITQ